MKNLHCLILSCWFKVLCLVLLTYWLSYGHYSDIWFGLVCEYYQNEILVKMWSLYVEKWLSYGHYSDIWFGLILYGLVWFCIVWCVVIVKTNFWWKFEVSMLKNDWLMTLCPNVAPVSQWVSESVTNLGIELLSQLKMII